MQKSLIERLPGLITSGSNFAYICRFTNEERTIGNETLFAGGNIFESDSSEFLNNVTGKVPFMVSFSHARKVCGIRGKNSEYPGIVGLIPEEIFENTIRRGEMMAVVTDRKVFRDRAMEDRILDVRRRIREGEVLQVVLSRSFGPINPDPLERLRSFISGDRSMYVFYYRFGKFEILGSSPENVITVDGERMIIEPIAGTSPSSHDPEENRRIEYSLLHNEKELLEHRMLVDLARNDLGKISVFGTVRVTQSMAVRKFNSVMHIVSRVESIKRNDVSLSEVLDSVFPAGTVSGAPKERAIEIIDSFEEDDRGPYSGGIGIAGGGNMDLALSIRCIYRMNGSYYARAGAGIVKDSIPENEVQEMFNKALSAAGGELNEIALCE
ncbi:MAG: anthranilate synthase component I family protein [Candidatus Thermoplasmatota archaeon]|nr:anthranilate synthase component I family protein [Candidatus Thermoplasmatota archaeon]MCL5791343.1 anthranilate synthase component I family protein [Candidatus Thermoplasmatota archaeon]